ncbi:hypothetical protein [Rickettsia oklahomensis]|uniref:Ankyrin repeat protein n=1 Tax=Rickettsia oklahomensis TaxID=3141789 RepID=A0AAU7BYB6_9RICK
MLTNLDANTEFNKYRDKNFLQAAYNMHNKEMVKLLLTKRIDPVIEVL